MSEVFGFPVAEVLQRIGSLDQVARVDSFVEAEGAARGARRLRVVNGGGLEFDIHPDRGLDIGAASFQGLPLAWLSSTGIGAPALYDPVDRGWLRTFGGGLVTTCGLDSFGPPQRADGRWGGHVFNLGHGINQHTPVEHVQALVETVHSHSRRQRRALSL